MSGDEPGGEPHAPRLLFLNPVGILGGAERVLLDVLTGVREVWPEARPTLLCGGPGPLLGAAERVGVRTRVLPMPAALARLGDSEYRGRSRVRRTAGLGGRLLRAGPALAGYAARWRAAVREERPDLIHSNAIKTHLLTWAALATLPAAARAPVVWSVHDFFGERPLARRALRRAGRGVAALAAVSEAVARDVRGVVPGGPVAVIPNAVDLARFSPGPGDGGELDRAAGLPPAPAGTLRVGLAATYARWKGQDVFLDAAALLLRRRPDLPVRFYVVGGPIYATAAQWSRAELEARAAAAGLTGRVGFVPFRDDVEAGFRALDVAVHASVRPEPFGLTIAEAMACGRPVVVSAAGGAAELFTDGVDAVGCPPGDAAALSAAVERLADDPGLRDDLGAAARRTAEARFDRGRLGGAFRALYADLLTGRGAPRAAGDSPDREEKPCSAA